MDIENEWPSSRKENEWPSSRKESRKSTNYKDSVVFGNIVLAMFFVFLKNMYK